MRLLTVFLAIAVSATSARAGVLLIHKTEPVGGGQVSIATTSLDRDRVRVESSGGTAQHILIYRADRQVLYLIDSAAKTYQELTKQQLEQMMSQVGDQMAQMRAMMDEQLKNVPPEQRAMVEQMMKGRMGAMGGAAPPAETVYRKVAVGERAGQWTCDRYEGYRANEKVFDVWTTDWQALGLNASDFRVMQELADLFTSLSSQMGGKLELMSVGASSSSGLSGIPVRRVSYRDAKAYETHEITEVSRQEFAAGLFEPPPGFHRTESSFDIPDFPNSPQPRPGPATSTTSAGQQVPPSGRASAQSCSDAVQQFRNGAPAALVRQSCSAEVADAVVGPASTGAGSAVTPRAASAPTPGGGAALSFSSEPAILQGGNRLGLSAKRVLRTAVQTAKKTAVDALADYAVRKAIQTGMESAIQNAAAQSAASSLGGGIGRTALSGIGGFGRRGKPGFEFVVMETADAALWAAAGEATFLIPTNHQNLRLVRMLFQEGIRVLASRKGRVRSGGGFDKPEGNAVMEEISWRLMQSTTQGAVYKPAQPLQSGSDYALVDAGLRTAFDFSVR